MIRAVFFDVDGTLLSLRDHGIPPDALRALRQLRRQGILLFLCTGRHPDMLAGVRAAFDFDGYLTTNAQRGEFRGREIYSRPIPPQGVEELLSAMEAGGFSCIFLGRDGMYTKAFDPPVRRFLDEFQIVPPALDDPARARREPLYQAIVLLDRAHEGLLLDRAEHLRWARWHPTFLDAFAPGGGKDEGMRAMLDALGIPPAEVMAFGDGGNDIPMLRAAGIGVAMGNAERSVRDAADYVTGHVDEGGLAAALRHFGLIPREE